MIFSKYLGYSYLICDYEFKKVFIYSFTHILTHSNKKNLCKSVDMILELSKFIYNINFS